MKSKDDGVVHSIVAAAQELLQKYGLSKTTMEDIARAAGKGKSTLYYYFKCKEEIFDEVVRKEMDDFFLGVKNAVDKEKSAIGKLNTYIVVKIGTISDKVNLYRLVKAGLPEPQLIHLYKKFRDRYDKEESNLIKSILSEGFETKMFTLPRKNDLNMLVELLISCVRGVEYDIITKKQFNTLPARAHFLVKLLLKGCDDFFCHNLDQKTKNV